MKSIAPHFRSVCASGPSAGYRRNLSEIQVVEIFRDYPEIMHIETPSGYYLREQYEALDLWELRAGAFPRKGRVVGRFSTYALANSALDRNIRFGIGRWTIFRRGDDDPWTGGDAIAANSRK